MVLRSRVARDVAPEGTAPGATVLMPEGRVGPVVALLRRLALALGALTAAALVVYFQRDGYIDNNDVDGIGLVDAFYYATVSLSTTGYGDIVPVSQSARLWTILVITPLRPPRSSCSPNGPGRRSASDGGGRACATTWWSWATARRARPP
ncbi:MAG: TrkA-N domain protein [Actinomycetospora sp.]|nr:TrkA-N domain protein [Actinomycetospora sp.]